MLVKLERGVNFIIFLQAAFFILKSLGVNFINILLTNFLYKRRFGSFFSSYMYVTCTWKKLPKRHSYKKRAHIKLMKLTVGQLFSGNNLA